MNPLLDDIRTLDRCGELPNCVCTQDERPRFRMKPIHFSVDSRAALNAVQESLKSQPRTTIVRIQAPGGFFRIHAVCTSRFFRFRDDVEFLIDAEAQVIHFRSASRVGLWDLGCNRRRMVMLTRPLRDRLAASPCGPSAV